MQLTFEARQDIRRLVAVFGVALTFTVAQAVPALALSNDRDNDGLSGSIERNVTETNPRDADSDKILDGNEYEDRDGVDNTNELSLDTDINDDGTDDDGVQDEDENREDDGDEDDEGEDDDED